MLKLKNIENFKKRRTATDEMASVVAKLAKEFDAIHVPLQEVFDYAATQPPAEHWIWDGVHPLPQGHELIAREWMDALK